MSPSLHRPFEVVDRFRRGPVLGEGNHGNQLPAFAAKVIDLPGELCVAERHIGTTLHRQMLPFYEVAFCASGSGAAWLVRVLRVNRQKPEGADNG